MNTLRDRADRALDVHMWLWENHHRNPACQQIVDGMLADPERGGGPVFNRVIRDLLNEAHTWTATPDMLDQVREGVDFLYEEGVDDITFSRDMVPAPSGVVIFPHGIEVPITQTEIQAKDRFEPGYGMVTRWSDTHGGDRWMVDGFAWRVTHLASTNSPKTTDPIPEEERPLKPGWHWCDGVEMFILTRWRERDNDRPFRLGQKVGGVAPPPWVVSDFTGWAFDQPMDGFDPQAIRDGGFSAPDDKESTIRLRLIAWLYWRFAMDILPARERPSRPAARRAKPILHEGPDPDDGKVLVVRLRHEINGEGAPAPDDAEAPFWRCRWIVGAHSARRRVAIRDEHGRPVGPVRGPDSVLGVTFEYKVVQISSFEKGPAERPLRLRNKVHVLAD